LTIGVLPPEVLRSAGLAFDYTGFEPIDPHGSRFHNVTRKDEYGLRYQVAGPYKPEGCAAWESKSFGWMRVLVWRRDARRCQACGLDCTVRGLDKAWNPAIEDSDGEVQHILPRRNGGENCGHNLVLLCRVCHVKTFRNANYAGIPSQPPGAQARLDVV